MKSVIQSFVHRRNASSVWQDTAPVRGELFGVERLEQHARSLAAEQSVTQLPPRVLPLQWRLKENAGVLLAAYRANATELEQGREIVPAAEWLLDNYHVVEKQVLGIRADLPSSYYRQLPKMTTGPFAGYPRVFGVAWAFVAHTDSNFDPETLRRFLNAYQKVQPLTIGELWAAAITLRIVLIENLRRLSDQISKGRKARHRADDLALRLLQEDSARPALEQAIRDCADHPLCEIFSAHLAKRLRGQDPETTPALGWLEVQLEKQGSSITEVVLHNQQKLGASNVTVRNIITSMRLISDIDWSDWFESVSLVDARLRQGNGYAGMDFPTRNLYRSAIEQLAQGSTYSELEIAQQALDAAASAQADALASSDPALQTDAARLGDPGYHLIAEGRRALEKRIDFKPPVRMSVGRFNLRLGIGGYIGVILLLSLGLLALALAALTTTPVVSSAALVLFALLAFLPATEVATALVNRIVTQSFGASALPGLELKDGVPQDLRTMVVMPTLLTSEADLLEQIEQLEVHYLSSAAGDLSFALLTDGLDSPQETIPSDEALLEVGRMAMQRLNQRHGPGPVAGCQRFLLLHRRRVFNESESVWMGWERKRGKLHELNRLLRGAKDTTFLDEQAGGPSVPQGVRYVITLDADTRLPRDTALRLIGKMAHPLNRARFDAKAQRVVHGYGILQPRVTPALPIGHEGSIFQRVYSGPGGVDAYAAAVSDVYQDLFGEGSYTGKGIYDVDAFEAAMAGRVPDNTMLSHDLFEGSFARAGLATDVEVIEEFPYRYDVAARRLHRWTRGDWQLLPWIFSALNRPKALTLVGRGKMLDNLRRSLLPPIILAALFLSWLLPDPAAAIATLLIMLALTLPALLPLVFALLNWRNELPWQTHARRIDRELRLASTQIFLNVAMLPDQSWRMVDAILRTLTRLFISRRHMLEWTTSAQASASPHPDIPGFYRQMLPSTALGVGLSLVTLVITPSSWPLILPFTLLWLSAPAVASWASQTTPVSPRLGMPESDARELRMIARHTWRYFETFVTASDNMLPPDNFQETPRPVVARRTSPTNIGLYLLSAVAARDFGWTGTIAVIERLEATFDTLQRLPRYKGHFFNWYGTEDLRALEPAYVSSVDSGNLAGHLIALANVCEEWCSQFMAPDVRMGLLDQLYLARTALDELPASGGERVRQLHAALDDIDSRLHEAPTIETMTPSLRRLADKAVRIARDIVPSIAGDETPVLLFWLESLIRTLDEHQRDREEFATAAPLLRNRLQAIAISARTLAMEMDFSFLLDKERKLLSIGYSLADNSLDTNCYDLLASEARLASLFAIAKGDVPTRHWFRLGRSVVPVGVGSALVSWSGSMFEYLMPSLVMRAPAGSLLEQTNQRIVQRQQEYGKKIGTPWGISESAYSARDMEFTYQYSNFGVPGLGLKRGLTENTVIAPYATGLATMIDPLGALRNYQRLARLGGNGHYGFYEALDFTSSRLQADRRVVVVRNYMAHHQGMTIVAILNTLYDGLMRRRFHNEPLIQAAELLLQERMPQEVPISQPRAEEVRVRAQESHAPHAAARRIRTSSTPDPAPITHLLSNGRYAVMLTTAGGGYSRWREFAVTRWREDATCDDWGSFIYLRDVQSGLTWSAGNQPMTHTAEAREAHCEVVFSEDHAEYVRREGGLTTAMQVLVSGEDDGEVRRLSLTNSSRRAREIDVTSYAEIVLAPPASDNAHPAFSKMFVETEYLPEFGALVATRRRRTESEQVLWAAHFAVVEGEVTAEPEYESDRARFIGRGHTLSHPAALDGGSLSNTVGTVLDPVFSLRRRLRIPGGEVARVAFWTLVASSREELLDLIDKHHDRSAYERAKTLAWTQAQVQLRHLDINAEEAADFQQLAAPLLYADRRFRAPSAAIIRGAGQQSTLWQHSISGDLPIVVLRIDDTEDIAQVRQLLRAHEYWRMKRLAVDLVIINERSSSYVQDLQIAIETAVRSSQARPRFGHELAEGAIHVLRADLMPMESRNLLQSIARIALIARRGPVAGQLTRLPHVTVPPLPRQQTSDKAAGREPVLQLATPTKANTTTKEDSQVRELEASLEFFNGLGGFDQDGREYVTILRAGATTPAPWLNVISNPAFGFQVSAEGSGYTWSENSRENQITAWSNDPVKDPPSEVFYLRDADSGAVWTPTALPMRSGGTYVARHGYGYSRFAHEAHGIATDLLQYVALADPIKISRLTLRNLSGQPRRLSLAAYVEWVLGTARGASAPFVMTGIDTASNAMLAQNSWNTAFPGRVSFIDMGGRQTSWTADRMEFLGRNGSTAEPTALLNHAPLSGNTGAGFDPCAALQTTIELDVDESVEIVVFLGQCQSEEAVQTLLARYREADLDAVLEEVHNHWHETLGAVQVKTPDRAMDIMLNGRLLYQTLACRIWARSAFYQASGAYGFRDQLQDGMALTFSDPSATRHHILRAASRQFPEGDVQHWWLPHSGQGVRTRISDDRVWLSFATATYIVTSGDEAILDEPVTFLEGPPLDPGQHDAFFHPMISDEVAPLFEHCARGLDQCLELTGEHGLPLISTGDWNDGMNCVGEGGQGESVWLGWLLIRTIHLIAPFAEKRDPERAQRWRVHARAVQSAIEEKAWDGEWYRRATFDDGTWLGSRKSEECKIDSIAQSWAVLSEAADPSRAMMAMASLEKHLIREEDGMALLFAPPFDKTHHNPGYIKGYPPGLRENGGQYTHAAMWVIYALTQMKSQTGTGNKAHALFELLNPINHALTPEAAERYKVEPYAVAADVYSVAPHIGRGGWTWYTGSAGWMYRAGMEGILGIQREGDSLVIDPCIPSSWPGFEARVKVAGTEYDIRLENPSHSCHGIYHALLDDVPLAETDGKIRVPLDGSQHRLVLTL